LPEAEQEPMLDEEEVEGEQPTMDEGTDEGNEAGSPTENDEQG